MIATLGPRQVESEEDEAKGAVEGLERLLGENSTQPVLAALLTPPDSASVLT